ncbi:hypothetical protein MMC29_008228 [Sticta canariensis]|nr:hypothetical protein [Sticta canariensis]
MHSAVLLPLLLLPFSLAAKKTVKVGDGGKLVFVPDHITAAKGDTIEFTFYPHNHSVAQSTFDKPCQALEKGIFSGFFTPTTEPANQTFTVTVNNTDPIWLYCSTAGHCQGGMAMVVNEPKDKTLKTYQDNSKEATSSSQSEVAGGVISDQSSGSSSSVSSKAAGSSSATAAATGATGSSTAASSASSTSATASPTNAVSKVSAGAGLGALGLLGVLVGGIF